MTASKVKYMVDGNTLFRDIGVAAITATASTDSVALPRSSGLEGHADALASGRFAVVIGLEGARTTGTGETYVFTVEVDDDAGFATNKKTVGTLTVGDTETATVRTIILDDDAIDAFGDSPAYVRVTATLAGTSPSIAFNAFLSPVAAS